MSKAACDTLLKKISLCIIIISVTITLLKWKSLSSTSPHIHITHHVSSFFSLRGAGGEDIFESLDTGPYKDFPNMSVVIRTAATPRLLTQFYCMFLRTALLFWPPMYGDIVLVLDADSKNDKKFGDTILKQMKNNPTDFTLKVHYEPLPKNPTILHGKGKPVQYTRQIWSTFFSDLYSNESIIAYMDTDVLIQTTVTKESLMSGEKLKVFGYGGFSSWVHSWDSSTQRALGLPQIVNFMVTFPQLIHRDTYTNCRKHIMKHLNTTDFELAFNRFHPSGSLMSPINVILTYAWFHEKDRYDWHLKIPDIHYVNSRLPEGHKVKPEDRLPAVIPVAHISDKKTWLPSMVSPGYCLSMAAQGQTLAGCKNIIHDLGRICDFYERDFKSAWLTQEPWCSNMTYVQCCGRAVEEHYVRVKHMAEIGVHRVQRKKAELVTRLAQEMGVTCAPLTFP